MSDQVDTDALRKLAIVNHEFMEGSEREGLVTDMRMGKENAAALCAAADEIDRLRVSDGNATQQRDQLADALRRSDNENDRLRKVIEAAPHDSFCIADLPSGAHKCICWKATAL